MAHTRLMPYNCECNLVIYFDVRSTHIQVCACESHCMERLFFRRRRRLIELWHGAACIDGGWQAWDRCRLRILLHHAMQFSISLCCITSIRQTVHRIGMMNERQKIRIVFASFAGVNMGPNYFARDGPDDQLVLRSKQVQAGGPGELNCARLSMCTCSRAYQLDSACPSSSLNLTRHDLGSRESKPDPCFCLSRKCWNDCLQLHSGDVVLLAPAFHPWRARLEFLCIGQASECFRPSLRWTCPA